MHHPNKAAHNPFSRSLARMLASPGAAPLTVNELLGRTHGRGIYLVFIILSLPFALWMPLPGMSIILGLVIALLALKTASGLKPRLPAFLGNRQLSTKLRRVLLGAGMKLCRALERISRPRRTRWLAWGAVRTAHALLIALLALLIALPLPPFPFLGSNALPSYAIILLSASMMEDDGALIWLAYSACLANAAYFFLLGGLAVTYLAQWLRALQGFLAGNA